MAKFKVVISDPQTGKSQSVELEEHKAVPLIGKKIGETIDGTIVGLPKHKLLITGGTDKDGFPMHPTIHGGIRKSVLLKGGVGFKPKREGHRRRKTLRGNTITEEIVQVNMKIIEKPKEPVKKKAEKEQPPVEETPAEEAAQQEKTSENKEEPKPEGEPEKAS